MTAESKPITNSASISSRKTPTPYNNQYTLFTHLLYHINAGKLGLDRLWSKPFATFLTVSVLAIALALPTGFLIFILQARTVSGTWNESPKINLFLKQNVSQDELQKTLTTLQNNTEVASLQYISPEEGLAQFKTQSGFGEILNRLSNNPLPGVVEVTPVAASQSLSSIQTLQTALMQTPNVVDSQLDMQWLLRLQAILNVLNRVSFGLLAILAIAVLLIVGNTIRLSLQQHRQEIAVQQMMGATTAYVQRPFLYTGLWYGLVAGLMAIILLMSIFSWLNPALILLFQQYGGDPILPRVSADGAVLIVTCSTLLAWLGALFTIRWNLSAKRAVVL